jgi:uncharacterized protein (DUF1015 family)
VFDTAIAGPLDGVTAPPYDVISDHRRLEYLRASPFSVVHLDLAEGSDDPSDPGSRYARAAHLLDDWEERGALRRSTEPMYYAYEMTTQGTASPGAGQRTIRGVICAMRLEDWGGTVLPHEHVLDGPVQDRLALLRATRTHLSPVYGTIDGPDDRFDALARSAGEAAPFEAVDEQGVRHRMWPVPGGAADLSGLDDERLLIADGHHRYTTALRFRDERRGTDGAGPWDAVLTLVVDAAAEHLPVLPFHRVQLAGRAPTASGDLMPGLTQTLDALADDARTVGVATVRGDGGVDYRVRSLRGDPPTVRALHDELLAELAPAGSLRYVPDAHEAIAALRRDGAVAVYLLPPTTPDRIRAVVERGERLPQKSTFFWPKPRTGMVMMPLDHAPDRIGDRAARAPSS